MAWMLSHKRSGSSFRTPVIVYSVSQYIGSSAANFSYTFTESGTFQYYFFISTTISFSTIEVKLNNTAISPMISGNFVYGEVVVEANDVFNIRNTFTANNCGAQIFIMKNVKVQN